MTPPFKNENPVVSVIMPVKDAENTIKKSVESILTQTLPNLEFIIVNDSSTDNTKNILNAYVASDKRVKIVDSTGQGVCDALNRAIELAKSPLIARMDADDISHSDRLQMQVNKFKENKNLVLLGTFFYTFEDGKSEIKENKIPTTNSELQRSIRSIPTFAHPTIMVNREIIQKVGGYRKKFDGAEDHDLYLRLSHHGEFAALSEFLLWYRTSPNQLSQIKKSISFRASVAAVYCDLCERQSLPDPSKFGMSCEEMAFELLHHEFKNVAKMSKSRLVLCARAIRGLALLPELQKDLLSVRRKILYKLTASGQLETAFSLWRRTRKKNWL